MPPTTPTLTTTPSPVANDVETLDAVADDVKTVALNRHQRRSLARYMRFLVGMQNPSYLKRARRNGYTPAEHELAWKLWRTAAGEDRPLDHWFAEGASKSLTKQQSDAIRGLLQAIDEFENLWLPRARAIIRRVVPTDQRDGFLAAFFKDLEQQSLGPAVVGSVSLFLQRVEALATSKQPHAREVFDMLVARGLDKSRLAAVKELLKQVEQAGGSQPETTPAVDAVALDKAQQAQLKALADLGDWFNDWATTLRTVFPPRDQIILGLVVPKGRGKTDEEGDGEEEEVTPS